MATTGTNATPKSNVKSSNGPQIGPYIFGKTLGTGATGKVKLAKHVETGELAAIKIVRKEHLQRKPSLKKKLQREITVMKLCNHPNVLRLLDVFEIQTHLFLVLEYVDGCELFEYLVQHGSLSPEEALRFFRQIIAGVEYCHKRLICHRDLKPENLLLDRDMNLKVADFGMTNLNPPGSLLETSCGSPHYAAPEVVSGEMYNGLEADIWSCGVILFAMVAGRLPFDDDNIQRLLFKVQRGVFHFPPGINVECKNLIKGMMMVDPKKRLTIAEIRQNAWFNSIKDEHEVIDTFVAPEEPILNPNPAVLQGLVDLGWGDSSTVRHELATKEANLEKVFYIQLERHPMFHKNVGPDGPVRIKASSAAPGRPSLSSLKAMMKAEKKEEPPTLEAKSTADGEASAEDPKTTPDADGKPTEETTTTAAEKETTAATEEKTTTASDDKKNTAAEDADKDKQAVSTESTGVKNSPSLVRQAHLTGRGGKGQEIDLSTLSIHGYGKQGPETSWFDTFRLFFIGGGADVTRAGS